MLDQFILHNITLLYLSGTYITSYGTTLHFILSQHVAIDHDHNISLQDFTFHYAVSYSIKSNDIIFQHIA